MFSLDFSCHVSERSGTGTRAQPELIRKAVNLHLLPLQEEPISRILTQRHISGRYSECSSNKNGYCLSNSYIELYRYNCM